MFRIIVVAGGSSASDIGGMFSMTKHLHLLFFIMWSCAAPCFAQDTSVCGPAPSEDVLKDVSSKTKGDLQGKAEAISKLVGQADLAGAIQTERRSIYQTSDKSEALRLDRYLAYVTCALIMKDTQTPLKDKLEAIQKFRQPVNSQSLDKSAIMQKFLTAIEPDTPFEKVTEVLGAPDGRKAFNIRMGRKKRKYTFSRYDRDDLSVYLIADRTIRSVAVFLKRTPIGGPSFPIPTFPDWSDVSSPGVGAITIGFLKDKCKEELSEPDAHWFYTSLDSCSFGGAGRGSFFVFSFEADYALENCGDGSFALMKGKTLSDYACPSFNNSYVNFALAHFEDSTDRGGFTAQALASVILYDIYWRH